MKKKNEKLKLVKKCDHKNKKDKGTFDKCIDCGERLINYDNNYFLIGVKK